MARRGIVAKRATKDVDNRPVRWRRYPHLFLIVCEDGKTEPYYFDVFKRHIPNETIFLKTVGTGKSSKGVVEQAVIEKKKLSELSNKNVDEVWTVFDKDDADLVPANLERFNEAFKIAKEENISVAFSNEVFELWLLLHFKNVTANAPIPRKIIYTELECVIKSFPKCRNFTYRHGDTEVIDILLKVGDERKAVERAEALFGKHKGKQFIEWNPGTTVHVLVKRLRDLIQWYSC